VSAPLQIGPTNQGWFRLDNLNVTASVGQQFSFAVTSASTASTLGTGPSDGSSGALTVGGVAQPGRSLAFAVFVEPQ
jgi:hypothetical protein